jgi:hypothetical protein
MPATMTRSLVRATRRGPRRFLSELVFGPRAFSPALAIALAVTVGASGCRNVPDPALTQFIEARRLTAEARVQFVKASEASDRAVMADTDEASVAFAREAERATKVVEADAAALGPRLASLGYRNEAGLLAEFEARFAEYQKLDHGVLELAVENTNLKAQRLSFGPVREAADSFANSLKTLAPSAPAAARCRIEALANEAVLAVREIQVLQAPHIAEPDNAAMAALEKEMADRQVVAHERTATLGGLAGLGAKPAFTVATTALERFATLSTQLVALSRRNSNVRSLALALGQKPRLAALCDASLAALEDALAKEGLNATR